MRVNKLITVAAGTPVNAATGKTSAQMLALGYTSIPALWVRRVFVQMAVNAGPGQSVGYVMDGIYGTTAAGVQEWRVPSTANSADVTSELAAATALAPGGSYSDWDPEAKINLAVFWLDGAHSGDGMRLSYDKAV